MELIWFSTIIWVNALHRDEIIESYIFFFVPASPRTLFSVSSVISELAWRKSERKRWHAWTDNDLPILILSSSLSIFGFRSLYHVQRISLFFDGSVNAISMHQLKWKSSCEENYTNPSDEKYSFTDKLSKWIQDACSSMCLCEKNCDYYLLLLFYGIHACVHSNAKWNVNIFFCLFLLHSFPSYCLFFFLHSMLLLLFLLLNTLNCLDSVTKNWQKKRTAKPN